MNTEETAPAGQELVWFKSSYSGAEGGQCVEVATGTVVHIRDSKDKGGPVLTFAPCDWAVFVEFAARQRLLGEL
ncbi:hypothetical protein P3T37_004931 [Kitasatospora sp. MAA4]|uniref:DUF397 domain-containing protein n=1 Tax=Kitasatospora sp. MAA4 TaxID=3035093 RepID=UPI002472F2EE|nr:DUF397 domain-containing protein [Kitasatospora sp. MAA4]MDH6135515.1 hypothetical protein [Kitasatospora sp. MAA4]